MSRKQVRARLQRIGLLKDELKKQMHQFEMEESLLKKQNETHSNRKEKIKKAKEKCNFSNYNCLSGRAFKHRSRDQNRLKISNAKNQDEHRKNVHKFCGLVLHYSEDKNLHAIARQRNR